MPDPEARLFIELEDDQVLEKDGPALMLLDEVKRMVAAYPTSIKHITVCFCSLHEEGAA